MRSQCIGSRNEDPFACWELDKQRQTCCQAFLPFPWDLGSKFSPLRVSSSKSETCNSLARWNDSARWLWPAAFFGLGHNEMAFRNGCCCWWCCCFHVLNYCAPLRLPARCTVCLLRVPDAGLPCPYPNAPWPGLLPVACRLSPEMYLPATPFIKTLNTKYMACVIVIRRVSGPLVRPNP